MCVCVCVCVCVHACVRACVRACVSAYLSICLSGCLSGCLAVWLSGCLLSCYVFMCDFFSFEMASKHGRESSYQLRNPCIANTGRALAGQLTGAIVTSLIRYTRFFFYIPRHDDVTNLTFLRSGAPPYYIFFRQPLGSLPPFPSLQPPPSLSLPASPCLH